jgi:hypothetical protein
VGMEVEEDVEAEETVVVVEMVEVVVVVVINLILSRQFFHILNIIIILIKY